VALRLAQARDASNAGIGLSNGCFGSEWRTQIVVGAGQQFELQQAQELAAKLVTQQAGANIPVVSFDLAVTRALNSWLQQHLFDRASLEGSIATFALSILVCVAQAISR